MDDMKKLFQILALSLCIIIPARAQETLARIVATVNDRAITENDLENRTTLIMTASGIPASEETRTRLRPQVLRTLIDEELELRAAQKSGILLAQDDLDKAFEVVAMQNNLTADAFAAALADSGVKKGWIYKQLRAQLSWTRFVQRHIMSQIDVTDTDIAEALERLAASAGKPEWLVAEIFIPVENPEDDASAEALATRIFEELKKGASFPAMARQFSQSAGAAGGGDLGWLPQGQLDQTLENALIRMQPGHLSPPLRSLRGWHILLLRDVRTLDPDSLPSTTEIGNQIGNERLDILQRRALRDLRASAFIDIRG
ncbi:MAG: hypothetical protein A2018_02410 [Alphaproteobacteria bacterium GWF2_58_20]|nr:MAG: hypothetical protein A2018_02410 [Alphaproteobacteria bacterium GWF2_58_20]